MARKGKNPPTGPNTSTGARLLSFIERIERLLAEIDELRGDIKLIKAEAKGEGFDVKTILKLIKLRAMTADERAEQEALLDLYKAAIGMLDGTPLGRAAISRIMHPPTPPSQAATGGDDEVAGGGDPPENLDNQPTDDDAPAAMDPADIEEARQRGAEDARAGVKVLGNPYVAGDPRRAAWDEGWCCEMGSDGMDLPAALRPSKKPPKTPPAFSAPGAGGDA